MRKILLALALVGLFAAPAHADGNFGIKAGTLSADGDTSSATQVGLVYTWDFGGIVGVEGELNTSLSKGAVGPVDYGVTQVAGYGVVMSPGPFYFKGKAGLAYTDLDFPGASAKVGAAYGVGVGFELVGFVWELEWTRSKADSADLDMISLSFKF